MTATPSRLWPAQAERQRHRLLAQAVLNDGRSAGHIVLLCLSPVRRGWPWARCTVAFRAVVADSGIWGRSGNQPTPLVAVEAAIYNLYHPTTL